MKTSCLKFFVYLCVGLIMVAGCDNPVHKGDQFPGRSTKSDYIRKIEGKSEKIALKDAQRGEVLIAYADCYTCHANEKRAKGPAFQAIAERYPVNDGYIELLALKIIKGGSGAWGNPVMSPHQDLTMEDARTMVKYILSLKKQKP